jgi:aryl-alcohol dehydrogenase-like predicted oxidoreductase
MSLDHYITLGRSGLKVSPLCLGAMTFGEEFGFGSTPADSTAILQRYLDLGGNFVDTANLYNKGHSEQIIGDYLARNPGCRRQMVLATKFSGNMHPGNPNAGGGCRNAILLACDESLRRLQTDYIDLYWQHWMDPYTPVEETMRALDDLVRAGKVRYLGFSDNPGWRVAQAQMLAHARGWAPLIALQIEYNLLERTVEGELIPAAQEFGLGVTPWSPLRSGFLTGKYTRASTAAESAGRTLFLKRNFHEAAFKVVDVLLSVAQQAGTTPARAAIAWLMQRPQVVSPIIGARTLAQLDDNLAALAVRLTAEQTAALDQVSKPSLNFPFEMVRNAATQSYGGMTINGQTYVAHGWAKTEPKK